MHFLNRMTTILQPILAIGFILFFGAAVIGWLSVDEYDDDYITVTLSCSRVLATSDQYPTEIIKMCQQIKGER